MVRVPRPETGLSSPGVASSSHDRACGRRAAELREDGPASWRRITATGAFRQVIVHTGQHYDEQLSDEILADLDFPARDLFLGVGSARTASRPRKILDRASSACCSTSRPALVVVAGDVNSTLACALAAAKLGIPVAHVESGLRSGDWTMPEEINRVLTDRLVRPALHPQPRGAREPPAEGIDGDRIHFVGNTMIDSLRRYERARARRAAWDRPGVERRGVRACHAAPAVQRRRAGPARDGRRRRSATLAGRRPVVFPVHPRTRARLRAERLRSTPRAPPACAASIRSATSTSSSPADRRRRDPDRLRRRAGGGLRARRPVLHAAAPTPSGRSR